MPELNSHSKIQSISKFLNHCEHIRKNVLNIAQYKTVENQPDSIRFNPKESETSFQSYRIIGLKLGLDQNRLVLIFQAICIERFLNRFGLVENRFRIGFALD